MRTSKVCRIISFILCLSFFVYSSGYGQKILTAAQWQSDLNYLQKKIHSDYSNLFYNVTDKQFDSAVAVLKKDISHLTENEIKAGFIRLLALFKIGHTGVYFYNGENEDNLKPLFHFLPFTISPFSDGLYIRQIDSAYKEALGARVIKIGHDAVDIVLKKMHDVIACENEQYFKSHLHYYLRLPEILQALKITDNADAVTLTYRKDGIEKKIKIKSEDCPEYAWYDGIYLPKGWVDAYDNFKKPASVLWLKEPGKLRYFEYLKESKTVYVRHVAVVERGDETIKDFFEKVFRFIDSNEVDKFVLDIRMNSGGNNYLNKSVITSIIQSKKINRYGHLFLITGAATFSAAQNLTNELEKYTEAIFVGEPTAENVNFWGDVKMETLPFSKLNIKLSWLWWQNMDPRDKRQGTVPNLAAGMSFENYIAGYDSAMSIIVNYKEEKRIDEKIKELVAVEKMAEALAVTKEYMQNPLHRYCKNELEEKINDMAYSLLIINKLNEANTFFFMNTKFFPNSANAFDSYAECLYRLGKKEEAIKNYEIAISKDPNGAIGKNSRKILALIKGKN
jgi:tetratricopeptide (TPR) repeat protein